MSDASRALGELGERIAERWLTRSGWQVVARRFRSGHRDIDLVVRRAGVVAFVEVKARRSLDFGDPVEAIGVRKRRQLARSGADWIRRFGEAGAAYRFDVVAVLVQGDRVRVRHVADAFPARETA
jgi:putative endonuclease